MNTTSLKNLAKVIRTRVLCMAHKANASHVGTCLSMADILAVLYGGVLRVDPIRPDWPERDRFILSKGHGAAAVYVVLAECGFFPKEWLDTYCQTGSRLAGHITHHGVSGVEVSTGSLGHGLPFGAGKALAAKKCAKRWRTFVLIGDGELDEGSNWEAMMFAAHHKLDNLVAIVDYNKIQSLGNTNEVLCLEPLTKKFEAFGWAVREIDGHDIEQIEMTLLEVPFKAGLPSCVIANTVKGKGVSFMENQLLWHYKSPNDAQLQQALTELEKV